MNQMRKSSRLLRGLANNRFFSTNYIEENVIVPLMTKMRDPFRDPIHDTQNLRLPFYEGTLTISKDAFGIGRKFGISFHKIDLYNENLEDKLSVKILKCPELLKDKLRAQLPIIRTDIVHVSLIMLSYENYKDPEQGRKECIEVSNEINFALSQEFVFSCFSSDENFENDRILYMYNLDKVFSKGNSKSLYANIEEKDNICYISKEKRQNSVGIIYLLSTMKFSLERFQMFAKRSFHRDEN